MIATILSLIQQEIRDDEESRSLMREWLDALMHWALNEVPQVVQMAGGPVALVVLGALIALVIWKRAAILSWWRARSSAFKTSVGVVAALAFAGVAVAGWWIWDFVQHDNEFCNSCHVMQEPFERFAESEHAELGCHDCHQQSIMASMNQLHMWVLARPEEVGPHAPVPTGVCVECHVTEDPDNTWQRISATAGHRVHLEADTSALADVMCVTCHGEEVHRFVPADRTCGQSGCHAPDKTQVVLGNMAGQTGFHCITCHEFTAPVAESVALDTARQALVPRLEACRSCHEMEKILVGLQPEVDPHDAVCGTCHDPHTQEIPGQATEKCEQCHARAELSGFHRGIGARVVEDCVGCHEAHTFRVEGDDCLACHADILGGTPTAGPRRPAGGSSMGNGETFASAFLGPGSAVRIPVDLVDMEEPGSTRPHLSRTVIEQYVALRMGTTTSPGSDAESGMGGGLVQQQARFDHRAHRDLECTTCHSMERSHGEITLESRRECFECHHTRPVVSRGCENCHRGPGAIGVRRVAVSMRLEVWEGARSRELPFDHAKHTSLTCSACHAGGPQLAAQRACADCHEDHHQADRDCMACHRKPTPTAHTIAVHTQGCSDSSCHGSDSYGRLGVGRNTCLACHQDLRDHRPGRACAACHQVSALSWTSSGATP